MRSSAFQNQCPPLKDKATFPLLRVSRAPTERSAQSHLDKARIATSTTIGKMSYVEAVSSRNFSEKAQMMQHFEDGKVICDIPNQPPNLLSAPGLTLPVELFESIPDFCETCNQWNDFVASLQSAKDHRERIGILFHFLPT